MVYNSAVFVAHLLARVCFGSHCGVAFTSHLLLQLMNQRISPQFVLELVADLFLLERRNDRVSELSYGLRKCLLLCVALMKNPKVSELTLWPLKLLLSNQTNNKND